MIGRMSVAFLQLSITRFVDASQPGFVELISTVLAALRGMVLLGFVSPEDRDAAYAAGRRHLLDMIAAWEPGS